MATTKPASDAKEFLFQWEGRDRHGKNVKGEMKASGEASVNALLRRQGILVLKMKKQRIGKGGKVSDKDVTLFTRQLATMMKSGVPLLQSFDIVGKGHSNPAVSKLLMAIKTDVETGSSLGAAFRKYPQHFDALFCNLVSAGESAGILDTLLERLATYKEKILAIKSKIKSALFYPVAIVAVAFIITAVIMIWVIPSFKQVFAISDAFVKYWYLIFGSIGGAIYLFLRQLKKSLPLQVWVDRQMLRLPVFGDLVMKSTVARWTRTLATMFAAGVPLVDALDSVGGAAGNHVYLLATREIQHKVSTGVSLTTAMQEAQVFPNMVIQMCAIGEESGSLDSMLSKVADFFEAEVDDAVAGLSSLMEPIIMVVLGTLIGGMVIAMYLPIFKLGEAV